MCYFTITKTCTSNKKEHFTEKINSTRTNEHTSTRGKINKHTNNSNNQPNTHTHTHLLVG